MRLLIGSLLCGLFLAGCHSYNEKPAHLLPEDTYINLMIELQLLKSYQFSQHPDSLVVDSIQHAIFEKYGTTKEQFKKSHLYYRGEVESQTERIQEAIERLTKDRRNKPDSSAQKDSTQLERVK